MNSDTYDKLREYVCSDTKCLILPKAGCLFFSVKEVFAPMFTELRSV